MVPSDTLRKSLSFTAGIIVLTLTGIFGNFEGRAVIENTLYFDVILLTVMVAGTAYLVAAPLRERGLLPVTINGLVGGLVVTIGLALVVIVQLNIDMRFVFQNLGDLNGGTLTFKQPIDPASGDWGSLLLLPAFGAVLGALGGALVILPARVRSVGVISVTLTMVLGMIFGQVERVIALPDALMLLAVVGTAYMAALNLPDTDTPRAALRIGVGVALGVGIALILTLIANNGGLERGGLLRGVGTMPTILELTITGSIPGFVVVLGLAGAVGALAAGGSSLIHNGTAYLLVFLLVLGVMNWQGSMTIVSGVLVLGLLALLFWFAPLMAQRAERSFEKTPRQDQQRMLVVFALVAVGILIVAPQFMGLYISNVFNLIALYAIMGIGLNVMIGYAGLLDLGYVASFAIGAYTLGILTTPNLITCGGVHPDNIPFPEIEATCTGVMSFWAAWPFCVLFSALTGALLGIPVLRLRGDYLAIVTLGFGEIINRIIMSNTFKPLLGGAQGITPIPTPELDLTALNDAWAVNFNNSTNIYYLFLFGLGVAAFVVYRLAKSRLGRAWRAIRADEDVAQAMGIHLVRNKLLAFGISSAFAGLGGAVFGASVQGIFPNSFTLLVSINVLSLIIIGGMGSIPGMIVGAMILVGLPELLRELDAYRLLAFGALLVTVMVVKPEGLLPPKPARLSEQATPPASDAQTVQAVQAAQGVPAAQKGGSGD